MKYAWIQDGRIRDIAPGNPADWYHPEVAKLYDTQVPDEAENGDFWTNNTLVPQPKPVFVAPPPAPRTWSDNDFRSKMQLAEKVKWDNNSAPEIVTVKAELPAQQATAQELVNFLVSANLISQATATAIMA